MSNTTGNLIDETISAFVDGEASEIEVQRLLKLFSDKQSDQAKQARQALVKHYALKELVTGNQVISTSSLDDLSFADSVSSAIMNEDIQFEGSGSVNENKSLFGLPFAKMAIAASVAFVFVLGAQQFYSVDSRNEANNIANVGNVEQAPVKAVVPEGYKTPSLTANTVSTSQAPYYKGIELDKAELQTRVEELMREVKQLQIQAKQQNNQ